VLSKMKPNPVLRNAIIEERSFRLWSPSLCSKKNELGISKARVASPVAADSPLRLAMTRAWAKDSVYER